MAFKTGKMKNILNPGFPLGLQKYEQSSAVRAFNSF